MSNIRTLTSNNNKSSQNDWRNTTGHKLQDMQTDDQDCGSSTGNKINKNTIIPQKLNNDEVCSLYEDFLQDLEDEDRDVCFEKLKKEKITGRTLVLACNNPKVMEELIKKLELPLEFKLRFDDMMKHVKQREKELKKETNDNENNENEQAAEMPASDSANTPKGTVQTISNAESVIGAMNNYGNSQNINTACHYYGKDKKKSP